MRDMEVRMNYMQEDGKRARDILESTLQEQIHLGRNLHEDQARQLREQWEREVKTRMAYQEQYQELINQERFGREQMEQNLELRVQQIANAVGVETSKLWHAMDKHTHEGLTKEIIVQQPAPQPIVEVLPPVVTETVMMPAPMVEVDKVNAFGQVIERDFIGGGTMVAPRIGGMTEIDKVNAFGQVVERDFISNAPVMNTIAPPQVVTGLQSPAHPLRFGSLNGASLASSIAGSPMNSARGVQMAFSGGSGTQTFSLPLRR